MVTLFFLAWFKMVQDGLLGFKIEDIKNGKYCISAIIATPDKDPHDPGIIRSRFLTCFCSFCIYKEGSGCELQSEAGDWMNSVSSEVKVYTDVVSDRLFSLDCWACDRPIATRTALATAMTKPKIVIVLKLFSPENKVSLISIDKKELCLNALI
jgi:hypothetical protein